MVGGKSHTTLSDHTGRSTGIVPVLTALCLIAVIVAGGMPAYGLEAEISPVLEDASSVPEGTPDERVQPPDMAENIVSPVSSVSAEQAVPENTSLPEGQAVPENTSLPEGQAVSESASLSEPAVLPEGICLIRPASASGQVWDVRYGSSANGAALQLYTANMTAAQQFTFIVYEDGTCSIRNEASGKLVDVPNGIAVAGCRIWQYERNGSDAQRWIPEQTADGEGVVFRSVLDPTLVLALDPQEGDGTPLRLEAYDGTAATQRFVIAPFMEMAMGGLVPSTDLEDGVYRIEVAANPSMVLDITAGSLINGANVQLWTSNSSKAQLFRVTRADDHYRIETLTGGRSFDVTGRTRVSSANVQLWDSYVTPSQLWDVYPVEDGVFGICSAGTNMALDVTAGVLARGANVQIYPWNGTNAQLFSFVPVPDSQVLAQRLRAHDVTRIKVVGDSISEGFGLADHRDPALTLGRIVYDDGKIVHFEPSPHAATLGMVNSMRNAINRIDPQVEFINCSWGGLAFKDLVDNVDYMTDDREDVIIVMLGINDAVRAHSDRADFRESASRVLSQLAERCTTLIVVTETPIAPSSESPLLPMATVDAELRALCQEMGVVHLSLYQGIPFSVANMSDGLHMNEKGHQAAWAYLKRELGSGA